MLPSCASYKIRNVEVCVDMVEQGGYCFTTLTGEERSIPYHEWQKMRYGRFTLSERGFGEMKKAIEKGCEVAGNRCLKEAKKTLKSLKNGLKKRKMLLRRPRQF